MDKSLCYISTAAEIQCADERMVMAEYPTRYGYWKNIHTAKLPAQENFDTLRSYYYSDLLRCQLAFAPMNERIVSSK